MDYEVSLDIRENIAWITIPKYESSPSSIFRMASSFKLVCQKASQNESIRVAIITGTQNEFFISDQAWSFVEIETATRREVDTTRRFIHEAQIAQTVADMEIPILAAINGPAVGQGLEIALACDIRLATTDAKFQLPQINFGFLPWDGGTQRLPRIIGRAQAIELLLTGREIDAEEALNISMVHQIVQPNQLINQVRKLAEIIAHRAPIATRYAKEAVLKGMDLPLASGLRLETDLNLLLHSTSDRKEGINSFLKRRTPKFNGS
jgi:enoyl-CoA hydratase/carnithine racemase